MIYRGCCISGQIYTFVINDIGIYEYNWLETWAATGGWWIIQRPFHLRSTVLQSKNTPLRVKVLVLKVKRR